MQQADQLATARVRAIVALRGIGQGLRGRGNRITTFFTAPQNVCFWLSAQSVDATPALNSFGSGFEALSLGRPFIELLSHSVELRMRTASGSTTPPWPPH